MLCHPGVVHVILGHSIGSRQASRSPHVSPQTKSYSKPSHFSPKTERPPSQLNSRFLRLRVSGANIIFFRVRDLAVLGLQPQAPGHPPNTPPPRLVQLQLWTPQIPKTRPLSSVTPVSSANNRIIPPFNPTSGPSKIPRSTLPPHSTKPRPPLTTCTQAIPTTHGPLPLKATSPCHVARPSNTRRRPTLPPTVGWLHPLTVSLNELADNHFPNRPLD